MIECVVVTLPSRLRMNPQAETPSLLKQAKPMHNCVMSALDVLALGL
jgi:hypothetical protein